MVEATSGGATSRAIISVRGGVVSRPHPAPGTARGRVAASGQTGFANRVRFQSLVDQCSDHVSVNTRIITVAGAQGGRDERGHSAVHCRLHPCDAGRPGGLYLRRGQRGAAVLVGRGGTHRVAAVVRGRPAIRRAAKRSERIGCSEGKTFPLLRGESGRLSGLSASAFFHHRLFCCRKYSIITSVSVTINDAAFPNSESSSFWPKRSSAPLVTGTSVMRHRIGILAA